MNLESISIRNYCGITIGLLLWAKEDVMETRLLNKVISNTKAN
jgi:hypothetical protein